VTDALGRALLEEARERLVKGFPAQVLACLDLLGDEQIWWRANEGSNSVGNLVLHVCGSSRHFIGRGLGGSDYARDRPGEFAERGPLPKDDLKRLVRETAEETGRVLDALDPARLLEQGDRAGGPFTALALVQRTSHHWALHTGQIVFATKMLQAGAVSELWYQTMGPSVGGQVKP
jgi:uncharacterized damage-inducible protein DinB